MNKLLQKIRHLKKKVKPNKVTHQPTTIVLSQKI